MVWCASVFYRGAWGALKARSLHMDLPIAIGILAAAALFTVRERIATLGDDGSFREQGPIAGYGETDEQGELVAFTPANYVLGTVDVDGRPALRDGVANPWPVVVPNLGWAHPWGISHGGMVSGAAHTTLHTIRPALQFVKTKPGFSIVSSVFFMCLADEVLVYGDCAVNPNPTAEQLAEIERIVNEQIRANAQAETRVMSMDDAMQSGAMALFGEKYGDSVRVLSIGDFSVELCGGTHVQHAGDIGLLKITAETGIASGVRRIEAVTGEHALQWVADNEARMQRVAELVKASRDDVADKVAQLQDKNRLLEKELQQLKGKMASSQGSDLAGQAGDPGPDHDGVHDPASSRAGHEIGREPRRRKSEYYRRAIEDPQDGSQTSPTPSMSVSS